LNILYYVEMKITHYTKQWNWLKTKIVFFIWTKYNKLQQLEIKILIMQHNKFKQKQIILNRYFINYFFTQVIEN